MKKRKVYPGEVHHVCQQTIGGALVFYCTADYLVFFTIYCTVARRMGIPVLALCPMPDHLHCVVTAPDKRALAAFVQQYTHLFAREWNASRGRKGPLFKARFKSSAKLGNKQVKTAINYNDNNPVERKLVERAEDYRWNFLRYAEKQPPDASGSRRLREIRREMQAVFRGGNYLRYAQIRRWSGRLGREEFRRLADEAVGLWNCIDYEEKISYYGSYKALLGSLHDNTGSDYEIREERDPYSDEVYADCTRILLTEGMVRSVFDIPLMPAESKEEAARLLFYRTCAKRRQILKFLHLPPGRA